MKETKLILFKLSIRFQTSLSIDEDIKILKKINNLISKYNRTGYDKYPSEVINTLIILSNTYTVDKDLTNLIEKEFIEDENKESFRQIYLQFIGG